MDKYIRLGASVEAGKIQAIMAAVDQDGIRVQVEGKQYVVPVDTIPVGLGIGDYLVRNVEQGTYKVIEADYFENDYALVLDDESSSRQVENVENIEFDSRGKADVTLKMSGDKLDSEGRPVISAEQRQAGEVEPPADCAQ